MTPARALAPALLALALAACADEGQTPATGSAADAPAAQAPAGETPAAGTGDTASAPARDVDPRAVPIIYMALQNGGSQPHSVVFAFDGDRNGTPANDRAIRLTPDNGQCNPQELSSFNFGPQASPVFSVREAEQGVTLAQLPDFMAVRVSQAMLATGLAKEVDATKPLNLCTRNLWRRIVQQSVNATDGGSG